MNSFNIVTPDRSYPIQFTTYALVLAERSLKMSIKTIGERMKVGEAGFDVLVTLCWSGLEGYRRKHSPNLPEYEIETVANIIDEAGGVRKVASVLGEAFMAVFPRDTKESEGNSVHEATQIPS